MFAGQLTRSNLGYSMPADAPFYQSPPYFYRDIEIMMFTYITDSKAALKILPAPLELPDAAIAEVIFARYPFSNVGAYNEVAQTLFCLHHGEPVGYSTRLHVTNPMAMVAGREIGGFGKRMGQIEVQQSTVYLGTLEEPVGVRLCTATLVPGEHLPNAVPKTLPFRSLRVIPNPADPANPSLVQLIGSEWNLESGEMYTATGGLQFDAVAALNPYQNLPIVEALPTDLAEKLGMQPCALFRGNMSIAKVQVLQDL
jgi:acetoacetate decarboxylase